MLAIIMKTIMWLGITAIVFGVLVIVINALEERYFPKYWK